MSHTYFRVIQTAVTLTLSWWLEALVTAEEDDEKQCLASLEYDVDQWEQIKGANDLRVKGHLQDGVTQLDVLTASLHRNSPPASEKIFVTWFTRLYIIIDSYEWIHAPWPHP